MVVLSVAGELDLATSPKLDAELQRRLRAGALDVMVDLSHVTFIDAAAVGVLAVAAENAKRAGGSLVVRQPSPSVLKVFDILGLDGSLPVEHHSSVKTD